MGEQLDEEKPFSSLVDSEKVSLASSLALRPFLSLRLILLQLNDFEKVENQTKSLVMRKPFSESSDKPKALRNSPFSSPVDSEKVFLASTLAEQPCLDSQPK